MKIEVFDLPAGKEEFAIDLPPDSTVICVNDSNIWPKLYVMGDFDRPSSEERRFAVISTGERFSNDTRDYYMEYITSFKAGSFFFHLFEVISKD